MIILFSLLFLIIIGGILLVITACFKAVRRGFRERHRRNWMTSMFGYLFRQIQTSINKLKEEEDENENS